MTLKLFFSLETLELMSNAPNTENITSNKMLYSNKAQHLTRSEDSRTYKQHSWKRSVRRREATARVEDGEENQTYNQAYQ